MMSEQLMSVTGAPVSTKLGGIMTMEGEVVSGVGVVGGADEAEEDLTMTEDLAMQDGEAEVVVLVVGVEVEEILVHHPHLVVIGPFPWLLLEVLVLLESSALRLDKGKY